MTLSKLSLRNARRQARDYLVYFLTIVMAAALIYAFNGLVFSGELQALSSRMEQLPLMVTLASAAVVCIIGWLVSYTTRFMLQKRSRELGTYILIGLENRQVARLFFLENLAVGAVALACGLLAGNLLYQVLRAVTLALFHVRYTFQFAFSIPALLLTLAYFALIYLFALFKSRRSIHRMKIHELLYFERQNEGEVVRKERTRRRMFTVSIVLGVAGTLLLLMRTMLTGLLGAALVGMFLYGFFISFSSGVPAYFDKRPAQKHKGRTLLVFRALSSKLATMGVVMATIAVLFTATLIAEGSGMVFNALFQSRAVQTTSFDLFIGSTDEAEDRFNDYLAYVDEHIPVRACHRYEVYLADGEQVTQYLEQGGGYSRDHERDILMGESDYAALRAVLGYPPVALERGRYLIHCMPYLEDRLAEYDRPVEAGGLTLTPGGVRSEPFTQSLWDGNGRGFILVVPDEALTGQRVSHAIYAAMTQAPVDEADYQALCALRDEKNTSIAGYDTIFSKADAEAEAAAMCAMIVYPLYYLALVLTMAAATILTIQQLSETQRYRRQFRMLSDLGMDRREMAGALRAQFAVFYAMPAIPPVLISVPFITALAGATEAGVFRSAAHMASTVGVALGLFLGIYLIYILAAYATLRCSVLPD